MPLTAEERDELERLQLNEARKRKTNEQLKALAGLVVLGFMGWIAYQAYFGSIDTASTDTASSTGPHYVTEDRGMHTGVISSAEIACEDLSTLRSTYNQQIRTVPFGCIKIPPGTTVRFDFRGAPIGPENAPIGWGPELLVWRNTQTGPELTGHWVAGAVDCEDCFR